MTAAGVRMPAAAVIGCLAFLLLGWSGLLVPSLVRSIEHDFGQTDAGMGFFYLLNATMYGVGVLGGTIVTHRVGRRPVLAGGVALAASGLLILAAAGIWPIFVLGVVPFGIGCGTLDGSGNGLILDLFPAARGRALNLLHFCFSAGALACPAVVGRTVEAGVPWRGLLIATSVVGVPIAMLFARAVMPSGRHAVDRGASARARRLLLDRVLLVLGIAIAGYVASEVGVSNWLVRFLEAAPLEVATTALTLYWAGLTIGRLGSARIGDRFDHTAFATLASAATGILILLAVIAPSTGLSIALFGAAGISSGPIFPLIVAIGGDRYPDRSAAIGGYLAGAAVVGGISYPPVMGFLSVTVGLPVAMAGAGALSLAAALVLVVVRRR
ncbi:MAG: MFS transporter [Candidatus Eisenbacteria bacterium]|uniref:MFS transporter n=1 Tax=Eiseniibacteriota bacterium TaxID=2212470 RepID=A0A538U0P8_UNCEI|nr:MAG: MFS transporter [Candidatus Eisenbacteria bacterium]